MKNIGQYSKLIVVLLDAVLTALSAKYGHAWWEPVASQALAGVAVYLVPNQGKPGNGPHA